MNALYELWDYETGNCIGAYDDEATALAAVRDALRRSGERAAATLVLLAAPDEGEGERIAAGAALIDRARAAPPLLLRRALRGSGIADD